MQKLTFSFAVIVSILETQIYELKISYVRLVHLPHVKNFYDCHRLANFHLWASNFNNTEFPCDGTCQ